MLGWKIAVSFPFYLSFENKLETSLVWCAAQSVPYSRRILLWLFYIERITARARLRLRIVCICRVSSVCSCWLMCRNLSQRTHTHQRSFASGADVCDIRSQQINLILDKVYKAACTQSCTYTLGTVWDCFARDGNKQLGGRHRARPVRLRLHMHACINVLFRVLGGAETRDIATHPIAPADDTHDGWTHACIKEQRQRCCFATVASVLFSHWSGKLLLKTLLN